MRKLLGGLVLVAGVVVIGWYGSENNAKTMQAEITGEAEKAAQGTVHPISTRVSGRDITVSGIANDDAEREQILAAMNNLTGRRVVHDDLRVLETASPFVFDAVKGAEGTTFSGMIPREADRATLAGRIGAGVDNLKLMAGAPDAKWVGVVDQGLNSLDVLQDGTLSLSDMDITVSGNALTPSDDAAARSALSGLPEGYSASYDIAVLDDGTPFRLTLDRDEDGTVSSSGKIPSTMETRDLSAAFGADLGAGIQQSVLPPALADWPEVSKLGASALAQLRSGQVQLTEDTLIVTGVATPDGKSAAEALLASMPEGFTADADISLYDDGKPFSLEMVSNGSETSARGKFPADVSPAAIIGDAPSGDIRNAFISDDTGGFATVATNGVEALAQLQEGTLRIVGPDVNLSGTALTPTQADAARELLANLPDGYDAQFDIVTIDDGTPPNFDVVYTAARGATVAGKLPEGTGVEDIAAALDLTSVSGTPVQGLLGDGAAAIADLSAVSVWLPELESMTFNSNDNTVKLDATTVPGVDQGLVQSGLSEALGDDANVSVSSAINLPNEGTERTNQATRRLETLTNGYWLPVIDFAPGADTCNAQSAEALQADRITFLSGSAQLDAQSVRAISAVAAIVRKCLSGTDLNVEIGGHTDSQGDEALNLQLSQERADAVRTALIARGTAPQDIVSKGYGEAEPIAENETAEGRSANRRTTISFFTPVAGLPVTQTEQTGTTDDDVDTQTNTQVGE